MTHLCSVFLLLKYISSDNKKRHSTPQDCLRCLIDADNRDIGFLHCRIKLITAHSAEGRWRGCEKRQNTPTTRNLTTMQTSLPVRRLQSIVAIRESFLKQKKSTRETEMFTLQNY